MRLDDVVVVDHTIFPLSAGGTRLAHDVTEEEIAWLAWAMTWKFALYGLPIAGPKIRFAGGDRRAVRDAFLEAIASWKDVFLTGPDPRHLSGGLPRPRLRASAPALGAGPRGH